MGEKHLRGLFSVHLSVRTGGGEADRAECSKRNTSIRTDFFQLGMGLRVLPQ